MGRSRGRLALSRLRTMPLLLLLLSGCEAITDSGLFDSFLTSPQPINTQALSERGLGKMAKGEFLSAQALFDQALRANPRDVHALIGKGLVFQQVGELIQARSAFEAVLALRPGEDQKLVIWTNSEPQSVSEIASVNLQLLHSRGVANRFQRQSTRRPAAPPQQLAARRPQAVQPTQPPAVPSPIKMSKSEANVMARFETLLKLREEGLITPQEFSARRGANAGALLPLTKPPPSAGLTRSVPDTDQITRRLQAIRRALELRAITVQQHSAERTVIIDGLLPANPANRANPVPPPRDLLSAADAVRRIERLRDRGLVTPAENNAEQAAIKKAITPKAPPAKAKDPTESAAELPRESGPQPAVHIASYRSQRAANRGWAQLRRAHRRFLGKLKHEVTRVNLGRGKGVFYRLVAGPLKSEEESARVCLQLKRLRQYCEPAFIGG